MKNILCLLILAIALPGKAQQKLSYKYDGNDLYQFIGNDLNSPPSGALIAHYNLKPDAPKTYWGNYSKGISMVIEKGKVAIITLVVLSDETNQAFAGLLPEDILPDMTAKEVKKVLGDGAEIRDKEVLYIKGEVELHIYFKGKKIESVVLEAK